MAKHVAAVTDSMNPIKKFFSIRFCNGLNIKAIISLPGTVCSESRCALRLQYSAHAHLMS
jgi:hypothetical protein